MSSKIAEVPPPPPDLAGESHSTADNFRICVSNADGYLCHLHCEVDYACQPQTIYAIFTNPDNTGIFRDIKKVASRKVLRDDPAGLKIVEVEQIGEAKIMWFKQQFSTLLTVTEDSRDPNKLTAKFDLIRSDILRKFNGSWTLTPKQGPKGAASGTLAVLDQDVLPAGVPAFLKHVPVLGGVLRGICVRAAQRMVEDITIVLDKLASGMSWEDIRGPGTKSAAEAGAPKVHSHAVQDFSDDDEGGEAENGPAAAHQAR